MQDDFNAQGGGRRSHTVANPVLRSSAPGFRVLPSAEHGDGRAASVWCEMFSLTLMNLYSESTHSTSPPPLSRLTLLPGLNWTGGTAGHSHGAILGAAGVLTLDTIGYLGVGPARPVTPGCRDRSMTPRLGNVSEVRAVLCLARRWSRSGTRCIMRNHFLS